MKKTFKLAILSVTTLIFILCLKENVVACGYGYAYVSNPLVMYSEPSGSSEELVKLKPGNLLSVPSYPTEEQDGFVRVMELKGEGEDVLEGWVEAKKLDMITNIVTQEETTAFITKRYSDDSQEFEKVDEKVKVPVGTSLSPQPIKLFYKDKRLFFSIFASCSWASDDKTNPLYGGIVATMSLTRFKFVTSPYGTTD